MWDGKRSKHHCVCVYKSEIERHEFVRAFSRRSRPQANSEASTHSRVKIKASINFGHGCGWCGAHLLLDGIDGQCCFTRNQTVTEIRSS